MSATSATACEDIVMFYSPTALNGYALANNGDILFYNGTAWAVVNNTGEAGDGRIDVLPDNDYFYFVQNDTFTVYDESTWTRYTVAGVDFNDVGAVYFDKAYLVTAGSPFKVYKYDGDSVDLEYTATGSVATAEGIAVHNEFDIWVVTDTPGSYYHHDGRQWSFAEYPYSNHIGVVIGFNASAGLNMTDVVMFNEKVGYSVGENGLIMIFKNHYDERFDDVDSELTTILSQVVTNENLIVNASNLIDETKDIVIAMNTSMITEFNNLNTRFTELNATIITNFNQVDAALVQVNTTVNYIMSNVTFMNLYLQNTVYPKINDTYNFVTVTLYNKILGIEQTVNATQVTVNTINATTTDIQNTTNVILNRTPDLRAWITQ
jgi:hypothetical protein